MKDRIKRPTGRFGLPFDNVESSSSFSSFLMTLSGDVVEDLESFLTREAMPNFRLAED